MQRCRKCAGRGNDRAFDEHQDKKKGIAVLEYPLDGSLESGVDQGHTCYTIRMLAVFKEHKGFWTPARKRSMWLGVFLFVVSIFIQITLGEYSSRAAVGAPWVGDLFLTFCRSSILALS